ncbi:hypothetical protein R6Z07F_020354 [Ovis aries]
MGGLLEKVEEEETEIEIDNINLKEEASSSTERKRNHSDQPNGLDSETIQILMEKIKAILQQNPDRNMKENSTILVFYYHRQSKKKTENRPTADEENPEDSSDTFDNSPTRRTAVLGTRVVRTENGKNPKSRPNVLPAPTPIGHTQQRFLRLTIEPVEASEISMVIVSVNTVAKPQGLIDPVSLFPPELIRTCLSGSLWRGFALGIKTALMQPWIALEAYWFYHLRAGLPRA